MLTLSRLPSLRSLPVLEGVLEPVASQVTLCLFQLGDVLLLDAKISHHHLLLAIARRWMEEDRFAPKLRLALRLYRKRVNAALHQRTAITHPSRHSKSHYQLPRSGYEGY